MAPLRLARRRRSSPQAEVARGRARRLGLQARVTLSFGASALVLCVALCSISYFTARSALINQAENSILRQAYSNAVAVDDYLSEGFNAPEALSFISAATSVIPPANGSAATSSTQSVVYLDADPSSDADGSSPANWTAASPRLPWRALPESLRTDTLNNAAAYAQVVSDHGDTELAVGVPIPTAAPSGSTTKVRNTEAYFGLFSLAQVENTLHILVLSLSIAVVLTTIAGAVLGRWVSRQALRPLREVSLAALAIANGRLDTRLAEDDVPDLAVISSSFNRMVDRLQERIERDARFTSDVSHELRSPLTTLAAAYSVIEARREELPPRSAQALDLLGAEIRHFQQMLGDLLEISRLDAGVADFEPGLVEAGELVRRSVRSWAKEPRPRVIVRRDIEHRLVAVDKRRFERVIANLLDNAQRYAGGATRVLVERRETVMRVLVEDRGPGIAEHERERIFERFARGGHTAGQRGLSVGTGLGLALVAEHVKLHDGRVFVEPRSGGGASFTVELPLAEEQLEEEERASDEGQASDDGRRADQEAVARPEPEVVLPRSGGAR